MKTRKLSGSRPDVSPPSRSACRLLAGAHSREHVMAMNKDQVKGRVKEAEGKVKETVGKLVGNEKLEAKGKVQKFTGQAQAKYGDIKKEMKDVVKSVKP
jgi:uncharacterized protein YjbJ (UPF0337 family)